VWNVQIGILAPFHTLSAFNHATADNPFELDLKRIKGAAWAAPREAPSDLKRRAPIVFMRFEEQDLRVLSTPLGNLRQINDTPQL